MDSVKDFEELSKIQLENDLANARSELVQLQERYERAESARKILNEKYDNILKECDGTFPVTPLRSLNLTTPRKCDEKKKSAAQLRKERRQTLFTPTGNDPRSSRAFRPVLFEGNENGDEDFQGDIENDRDMIQERELLRLEIDNNRMSQIILEKEAAIKDIYEKQRNQSKLWIEEKNAFIENESSLNSRIESLEADKCSLSKTVNELKQQLQLLSTKLSSSNDQKCRLEELIEDLQSDKLDLEDRMQVMQNEQERCTVELRRLPELESSINELRHELDVALEDNRNLKVLNDNIEKKHHNQLMTLQLKEDEINQILSSCRKVEEEKEEVTLRYEDLERSCQHLRERHELTKVEFEEDLKKLKRRHMDELSSINRSLEMEQKAHDKTKQQFLSYRNTIQETFDRKLAELQDTFTNKERRLTMDKTEMEQQISHLQAERDTLLRKCSGSEEVKQQALRYKEELEKTTRELELLREAKTEDDRALTELVGHNNHKQKVSYVEKMRLENHNLKKRIGELEVEISNYRDVVRKMKKEHSGGGVSSRTRTASALQ
ncbi:hypothetical protein DICVIV_05162 [Dictyocaulus viviparus]|uniref:Uncharacterized protein n=1 Tax=Dictyocaulus viviparus TaxID=29172 RepID=A0A0D8Y2B4_DICVI|nr:hypothetical protein DICVIV_05162 [Dictyocaulus viviparus]